MSDHCRLRWRGHRQPLSLPSRMMPLVLSAALLLLLSSCVVTIGAPAPAATTGPEISAPVQVVQDQSGATLVLASVKIHGQGPFTFAVDTGASTSLISSSLAARLHLPQVGGPEPISGIGGVTQAIPVRVSNWNTGPIRLPTVTVASAAIPHEHGAQSFQGLLGSDIWSKFGKFTLDYSSSTMTVYQQIALVPTDRRLARMALSA
jgi:hypothetical protein